ncbi:MAG TPA: glycerophosphodiester phosphodiesterase [Herpetosiphonaceae bacterium]|nr:glycerophosphodiester phosphodiesterase [Herpetosiphonaceae bacterium]
MANGRVAAPLVIAHRGASGEAPENTMRAFELARSQGADMIELDVRVTADGRLVVFHDETTERFNGRPSAVAQLSAAELGDVRVGGEPVPHLAEACAWARDTGMRVNVELKVRGAEQALVDLLRSYDLVEQVIVSSFVPADLVALRAIAPEVQRGALMGIRSASPRVRLREAWPGPWLRRLGATAWHPACQLPLLRRIVPRVQRSGYRVYVWTVDDPDTMRQLLALRVDGIITNYPARLREIIRDE